jgi:hypothetical protein
VEKGETLAAVSGVGDSAFGECDSESGDCIVYAEVDDSWFSVDYSSPNATLSNTEAIAKEVVTAST